MTKMIVIETCRECPNRDHRGAFGVISYVPVCRKVNKNLPHEIHSHPHAGRQASPTYVIPGWCPLESTTPEQEITAQLLRHEHALDDAMIVSHIGVFNRGDDPREALNKLMCYSQSLGEYFAKGKDDVKTTD